MVKIAYPTTNKIIEYNLIILNIIKVKKADKPEVLSYEKIKEVINECKKYKGDIYDKATNTIKRLNSNTSIC